MRATLLFSGFALSLVACSPTAPTEQLPEPVTTTSAGAKPVAFKRKFRSITNANGSMSDTMLIDLHFRGDSITGRMDWLQGMKDKMKGTFEGHLRNDTLITTYSYSAEGVQRTEPRYFLLGPDRITILTGDLVETDEVLNAKVLPKLKLGLVVPEVR